MNIRYACHSPQALGFNLRNGPCFGLGQPTSFSTNQVYRKSTRFHQNQPWFTEHQPAGLRFHQNQPGILTKSKTRKHGGKNCSRGGPRWEKRHNQNKARWQQHTLNILQQDKDNTYLKKELVKTLVSEEAPASQPGPRPPDQKRTSTILSFRLSRRQDKPLASTKKDTCPEKLCTCQI